MSLMLLDRPALSKWESNLRGREFEFFFFRDYLLNTYYMLGTALDTMYWAGQRRQWHPTPVLLPGKSHGRRSLVGCSPWGREELGMTERLHFHFSLSRIGEGNGNPLHVLAWRIPGMGEPGGLLSMGSHGVGHDWSNLAVAGATSRILLFALEGVPEGEDKEKGVENVLDEIIAENLLN